MQAPTGRIGVNGEGIDDGISVDGADFDDRSSASSARPATAFTFDQDAIQEMVVVADGAAAEFGAERRGFVDVVTKSAHAGRLGDVLLQGRCAVVGEFGGREVPVRPAAVRRDLRRATHERQAVLLPRLRSQEFNQTKQLDPRASSRRSSITSPRSAARKRTDRSTGPTTRACSSARSTTS